MSITILPRSTYTSQPDGFSRISRFRRTLAAVTLLVAHYGAFGNVNWSNPTLAQTIQRLLNVRRWHVQNNGWADIGYDYGIDQAGRIIRLRSDDYAGAGAFGHNMSAVHVLFLIGDNEPLSEAARASFRALGRQLRGKFRNMSTRPRGHGSLPGNATACPGRQVNGDINARRLDFPAITAPKPSTVGSGSGGTYTVRAGNTLSGIAAAHGVTVQALTQANGIRNADLIQVGQRLTIPGRTSSTPAPAPKPANLNRSSATQWPGRALPQVFTTNSNPFATKRGTALDIWFDVVPASHSAALFEFLRRAGHKPTSTTRWGHELLIQAWLGGPATRVGIWRTMQTKLRAEKLYTGAVDGQPGNQTWWAITELVNRQRRHYT